MDLTKITTPFGLLDDETKAALKGWPHGWEYFNGNGWERRSYPSWDRIATYRAKPAPPKPMECWVTVHGSGDIRVPGTVHDTEAEALKSVRSTAARVTRFIEAP